jgi:hypothetical protein
VCRRRRRGAHMFACRRGWPPSMRPRPFEASMNPRAAWDDHHPTRSSIRRTPLAQPSNGKGLLSADGLYPFPRWAQCIRRQRVGVEAAIYRGAAERTHDGKQARAHLAAPRLDRSRPAPLEQSYTPVARPAVLEIRQEGRSHRFLRMRQRTVFEQGDEKFVTLELLGTRLRQRPRLRQASRCLGSQGRCRHHTPPCSSRSDRFWCYRRKPPAVVWQETRPRPSQLQGWTKFG